MNRFWITTALFSLPYFCPLPPASAYSPMPVPDFDNTVLHQAAEACDEEREKAAIEALSPEAKQEELDRLDREGYVPLAYAARAGCLEIVKLLAEAGASVDQAEEHGGWTPLLWAAQQRHAEVVRYLLDRGANAKIKTRIGWTPVSAALSGSIFSYGPKGDRDATISALLEGGADPSPLLKEYSGLRAAIGAQQNRIDALEEDLRRANEALERIRSASGDTEYRPTS